MKTMGSGTGEEMHGFYDWSFPFMELEGLAISVAFRAEIIPPSPLFLVAIDWCELLVQ